MSRQTCAHASPCLCEVEALRARADRAEADLETERTAGAGQRPEGAHNIHPSKMPPKISDIEPKKGRELPVVLKAMLDAIPEGDYFMDLKQELDKVRQSALYGAPENMWTFWDRTAQALQDHLPKPGSLKPWQKKVADIFMDKETANGKD